MLIDCDSCAVRGPACRDCVVTVLLGAPTVRRTGRDRLPGTGIDLDGKEQAAIAVLAGSGLVPPLRLVARPVDPDEAGVLNWDHEPAGREGGREPHREHNRRPERREGAA
ncbi:hypothetical protein LWF15_22635 [Kineosporia rhizophila]|uniref:hypothetical protein n=1 Tax=Kineosporia TaxID=49184 RepID=UPI001E46DBB8|nr:MULTISPECIES: hypothetical protein [Kineosporia]MCE0538300.1 hypothetical protein [Kineosporia rhizophila]GLY18643.1 hypothetical protein Kisp01_56570 [Kineosporia sp. NBRC 101677]